MMLEVPSAAFAVPQFTTNADFFNLGTNDLARPRLELDSISLGGHRIPAQQGELAARGFRTCRELDANRRPLLQTV